MSNLMPMLARTINPSTAIIPTDDTEVYELYSTLDETVYYLSSYLCQNPINKKVLHIFTRGDHHITAPDKKIVYRVSTDLALTFGVMSDLYDPTAGTEQVQDLAAGYDSNGRLHVLVDIHDAISTVGVNHRCEYFYSDDDGATISTPVSLPFPGGGAYASMRVRGHIRQNGNTLMATAYFFPDETDFSIVEIFAVRSPDLGATWEWKTTGNDLTKELNEADVLYYRDDLWIMVVREEINKQMWMFKSFDDGLTWLDCGQMSLETVWDYAHPPVLHKFKGNDGMDIAVLYFGDRRDIGNSSIISWYAKMSNFVEGGVGAWNLSTRSTQVTDTEWLHYGDFFHYNNNFNARGAWSREANVVPFEDNEMIYFEKPATAYNVIHGILEPETIYDLLNGTKAIYSARGLVANTANDWGTVDSSNRVTVLRSIRPGPLNQNLTATAGGILLSSGKLVYDGTKALTSADATYFQPIYFSSAGDSDVNGTVYFVAKFGTISNPNAAYGLYGNGQGSSASKGVAMLYDDRLSQSRNNAFVLFTGKGTAGTFNILVANDNKITPNTLFCGCVQYDLSKAGDAKVKFSINGVDQAIASVTYNASASNPPSFNFQLGAIGNNSLILVGEVADWVWQNAIDIDSVRDKMIADLMTANGL